MCWKGKMLFRPIVRFRYPAQYLIPSLDGNCPEFWEQAIFSAENGFSSELHIFYPAPEIDQGIGF